MNTDDTQDFDPDFSPAHEVNRRAAEERGLYFNRNTKQYVDEEGCPVRDEFGQPL